MLIANYIEKIKSKQCLFSYEIFSICRMVKEILINEPNIINLMSPICVLGDIHGQFDDLLSLMKIKGEVGKSKYLFLGDYVDRGPESIHIVMLLFCYKIIAPESVFFIRGNHEQKNINKIYGFHDEVIRIYKNELVYNEINKVFEHLSIAAIVDNKYFCVHGGISDRTSLSNIKLIDRTKMIRDEDVVNDLFWSDPHTKTGCQPNQRGSGVLFGVDATKQFLVSNNLEMVIRSHQLVLQGYKFDHQNCVLTIWSAPNYMNRVKNPGVVLYIEPDKKVTNDSMLFYNKK
ncbi:PPH3 [Ecytonucleospora hepatopenaei]|uniref:Serine/threonine-protein phosphatase n=1 Tax=Ecytonucleospora hepatopenaei TaxID=646526 RepID=A0A1W0E6S9_9MICR|nr:PPH3 [Ecytonucleospora hepatopenaei]